MFNCTDGGSSGAVYKVLAKNGLVTTGWLLNKTAVTHGELTQEQFRLHPVDLQGDVADQRRVDLELKVRRVASAALRCRTVLHSQLRDNASSENFGEGRVQVG